jgi:hypothetical protein
MNFDGGLGRDDLVGNEPITNAFTFVTIENKYISSGQIATNPVGFFNGFKMHLEVI